MADTNLTQADADVLIAMEKHRATDEQTDFPVGQPKARMIQDIQNLLTTYYDWLKDKTELHQLDQWVEITTPYLDRHNDYVQIYVKKTNGGFLLTDDGYIIDDLQQSGCKLDSRKRQALLKMTLNGFGVKQEGKALQVHASAENFASRKHNLVQAMLAVNDMFYLAVPVVTSLFYEDVVTWLDANDIRHTPKVKFTGTTGYDHLFDLVIPKSRQQPERIIQTINRPNRATAQTVVLAWVDTKEIRTPESRAYALLNDSAQTVPLDTLEALRSYDVKPIMWSQREAAMKELAA